MKTHIEIEVTLKGKYKKAQKQTETDPRWPSEVEDFQVWFGGNDITGMLSFSDLIRLKESYHELCDEESLTPPQAE